MSLYTDSAFILQLKVYTEYHFVSYTYNLEALMQIYLNLSRVLYLCQLRLISNSFLPHNKGSLNIIRCLTPHFSLSFAMTGSASWFLICIPILLLEGLAFAFCVKKIFIVLYSAVTISYTFFNAVKYLASMYLSFLLLAAEQSQKENNS